MAPPPAGPKTAPPWAGSNLAPAGTINPPAHAGTVQHYVLKGEYESQGVVYQEGTLRVVPTGSKASPITTTTGVTFLVVCDPTSAAV